jgi:uncharacterized protein YhaN
MRLIELRLLAFGPFSDALLDFGRERDAMQLIYGPNEAGKSTALRAIRDLLFGIPATTGDAHVHKMPKLRIGAKLEGADGSVLEVVRRKGRKDTLLRPDGTPMDEALLTRMLGGMGRSLFGTMFGLDHVSLREGAQALLQGHGDVGESLFDAGGARGVHRVLEELREEADALFKPRGQTPKLNEALKAFAEAKKRTTLAEVGVDAWRKQNEALERALEERRRVVS